MVQRARGANRRDFQGRESEERERLHAIRREEFDLIFRALGDVRGRSALDVGCGDGFQAGLLMSRFGEVVCIDVAKAEACQRLDALSDARALSFADASFDMVLLSNVLEHVGDRPRVVKECMRVLRGGGTLVISVPSSLWKLTEIRDHWLDIVFAVMRGRGRPEARGNVEGDGEEAQVDSGSVLRFLFPSPHGEYGGTLEELAAYKVSSWNLIFRDSGVQPLMTIRMPLYPSRRWDMPRMRRVLEMLGFSSSNCFVFRYQSA